MIYNTFLLHMYILIKTINNNFNLKNVFSKDAFILSSTCLLLYNIILIQVSEINDYVSRYENNKNTNFLNAD